MNQFTTANMSFCDVLFEIHVRNCIESATKGINYCIHAVYYIVDNCSRFSKISTFKLSKTDM